MFEGPGRQFDRQMGGLCHAWMDWWQVSWMAA